MKHSSRILLAVGFMAASLLGGLMATILAPTPAEAAPQASRFGPQIKVTGFNLPPSNKLVNLATFKLVDAGTFVVESSSSIVEVSFQGRIDLGSTLVPSNCVFVYIRIDDVWEFHNHMAETCLPLNSPGTANLSFSGIWDDLAAGSHSVSVWSEYNGGNLPISVILGEAGASYVIVKEYLPFGTTYMPSIHQ